MRRIVEQLLEIVVLFLPTGVILTLLESLGGITFSLTFCMTIGLCTVAFLYVLHSLHRVVYWLSLFVLVMGIVLYCRDNGAFIYEDVVQAIPAIILEGGTARNITNTMGFFTVLFSTLLFVGEYSFGMHGLVSVVVLCMTIGLLMVGAELSVLSVIVLLLFFVVFALRKTMFIEKKAIQLLPETKKRLWSSFMIATSSLIVVSFLVSSLFSSALTTPAYTAEGWITRTLQEMSGVGDLPEANGQINYGNNYKTGETELVLVTTEQPTETMYIRGFTGKDYLHGNWTNDTEDEAMEKLARRMGMENYTTWLRGVYGSMFFSMNYDTNWHMRRIKRQMLVYYANDKTRYQGFFTPYYTNVSAGNVIMPNDGYGVQYYEQGEMHVDWSRAEENRYYALADRVRLTYQEVIQDVYTIVPVGELERLRALCEVQNISGFEDATSFIQQYFMENLTYSTTPGRTPLNEDIVESFLFDSRTGYCQHYASAAVLMYRLFGIPCRYVAGYVVQPDDFVLRQDGRWEASVPDTSAHAWAEVFDENIGWTPMDLTPDRSGNVVPEYPGMEFTLPVITQDETSDTANTPGSAIEDIPQVEQQEKTPSIHPFLIICIAITGAALILVCRTKEKSKDVTTLFQSMMDILHHEKLLTGYTGTEEDFVEVLQRQLQEINQSDLEKMMDIVYRASFSNKSITEEETEFVCNMYKTIKDHFANKAKGIHRLYYWLKD